MIENKPQAMRHSPDEEAQMRTVPKPPKSHGNKQVYVFIAFSVSSEAEIHIIAQPC